jgi:DNA-binding NarL/FixJ family response regulator
VTIRVLLVDDHRLVRAGLAMLLERDGDLEVVGHAEDGESAVAQARRLRPDVVLMDIQMPRMDGLEATRRILAENAAAATRVVVLTTFETDEYVAEAIRAGASGFVLKDTEPAALREAVRVVAAGEALLSPSATRRLIAAFASYGSPAVDRARLALLTDRELEVVVLVARGRTNKEIADALHLSPATVKTHVSRAMMKLDSHDRAQLVVAAYETGLVSQGRPGEQAKHP